MTRSNMMYITAKPKIPVYWVVYLLSQPGRDMCLLSSIYCVLELKPRPDMLVCRSLSTQQS